MKITYDKISDSMYIKLNNNDEYRVTKKVTDDVFVDYTKSGKVIGVEVLNASINAIIPAINGVVKVEAH